MKTVIVRWATLVVLLMMLISTMFLKIVSGYELATQGVFTEAKLLEYKPVTSKGIQYDYYMISYDEFKGKIELQNNRYEIGSNIPVVYRADKPDFVWLSNKDTLGKFYELINMNTSRSEYIVWVLLIAYAIRIVISIVKRK